MEQLIIPRRDRPRHKGPHRDGPVPREWLGRARLLHKQISDTSVIDAADALFAPLRPTERFTPIPRRAALERLAETYKKLPRAPGRLRTIVKYEPGRLQVAELRLVPLTLTGETWEGRTEPAFGVSIFQALCAPPEPFSDCQTTIVTCGLHSVARAYERHPDHSDVRVLEDLRELAVAGLAAIERGVGEFQIPAPSGGCWIGMVLQNDAVIRTFLERGRKGGKF
jgi:hypothetical protein